MKFQEPVNEPWVALMKEPVDRIILPGIGALLVLVASFAVASEAVAESTGALPAPGLMVRVGDHRLHLYCTGRGEPTVILDSGLGGNSLDWVSVQPGVAEYTRVCTYDRAGYGWSELGPLPRTSERIAEELHTLLEVAGVLGPYVLVGHSFGGYNVRLFASQYPDTIAGVVLLDSAHEDQFIHFQKNGITRHTTGTNHFAASGPSIPENLPAKVRPVAQKLVEKSSAFMALRGEMMSFQRSAEQVRHSSPLPDVPVTVITRGKRVWPRNERGDRLENMWRELQDDLATRTTYHRSEAVASHVMAKNSGHYVHLDEPAVVINAIRRVVESNQQVAELDI